MNDQQQSSGSALGDLGSRLGQMDPSTIRNIMMMSALVAPSFSGPIESALGAALPAAEGQQQLSSLQNMFDQSGINKGGIGGLLSQLGGSIFGGAFNPQAHAYLQSRASTANSIANATGQDPNAVMAGLPDFTYSPDTAAAAFGNVQAPMGQPFSGSALANLPMPSAALRSLPSPRGTF